MLDMATTQVAFRLDDALVTAMDLEAKRLSDERPGLPITRADVVRVALTHYLASRGVRVEAPVRGTGDDATARMAAALRSTAAARIKAGAFTQAELARRSGIDKGQLSRFLHGDKAGGLSADRLVLLSKALDEPARAAKTRKRPS